MGALIPLRAVREHSRASLPLAVHGDEWLAAPEHKRRQAELRAAFLQAAGEWGGSASSQAERLCWDGRACRLPSVAQSAYDLLGEQPSVPTIKRWLLAHTKGGKLALLDKREGKRRLGRDWHHQAVAIFNRGSKPNYANVAKELQATGYPDAAAHLVRSYLKSLPTRLGENGPARVGPALHRLTLQKFQPRTLENLRAGDVYVGDGHTVDVYLAHPNTGKLWRPELSMFLDLKSRLPVGWWLGNSENVIDTLRALGHAIATHDHVPPMLYLDHGAGYRAKMMSADGVGFAAQMGIDMTAAHPGNPHGKGWVERFFRTVRDEHDKLFAGGEFYCGGDMAPEINRRLSVDVKAGRRTLPSLWDYRRSLEAFFARIATRSMPVLEGQTPEQVWTASFVRIPSVMPVAELIRPVETATVRRQSITLHKRTYVHTALIDWQGLEMRVRYDLHDDAHVWVCDDKDRFVCEAMLVHKVQAIPTSRIEEARQKATEKALQRIENKAEEIRARGREPITADTQVKAIEQFASPLLPTFTPTAPPPADGEDDINLLDWKA